MVSLVTGCIGLLVAVLIILLIRKDRLHVTHGMGWIVVAVGFALLGIAPGIVDYIAGLLGIASPPLLAITAGISILVIKILLMDIEFSRSETRNLRLVQRLGMLEAELQQLRERTEESEPPSEDDSQISSKAQTIGAASTNKVKEKKGSY